jgi:hypothetical protein
MWLQVGTGFTCPHGPGIEKWDFIHAPDLEKLVDVLVRVFECDAAKSNITLVASLAKTGGKWTIIIILFCLLHQINLIAGLVLLLHGTQMLIWLCKMEA